jgi:uncharacterized protein (TIGR03435 family)
MRSEQLRHGKWLLAMLLALFPLATALASAQTPPAQASAVTSDKDASAAPPSFEVVSIKPDKSGTMMMRIMFNGDGISVTNVPVHMLLREALGLADNQLLGEPGWVNSDRFDIEAKVAAEEVPKLKALKPTERWAMLLPVFQDRFALKFHHESKDLTQYVLVIAKGGLKMKEARPDDTYADGIKVENGKAGGAGMMRVGPGEVIAQAIPIANFVKYLSFQFQSPVIDKTGLTGKYDINLKWTPDEGAGPMLNGQDGGQPGAENPVPPATAGPSIFTAIEEQLGLKIESHKEPADVIVIDHIVQPSPN